MDSSMKLYWTLVFEKQSTKVILRHLNNPIREYEEDMIDGTVIDIGCGQSPFLLDLLSSDRKFIAIDNEQIQLDYLRKRVENEKFSTINNWKFLNLDFPKNDLPTEQYSLIILSDLLHFFTLNECIDIGQIIAGKCIKGTLVYIAVHSDKFYANDPNNPDNNEYFKHYFTISDLETAFPLSLFDHIYSAEIEKSDSKFERDLVEVWINKSLKTEGITNPKQIAKIKKEYFKDKKQSSIVIILRKK
jgi:hypothetical protein